MQCVFCGLEYWNDSEASGADGDWSCRWHFPAVVLSVDRREGESVHQAASAVVEPKKQNEIVEGASRHVTE